MLDPGILTDAPDDLMCKNNGLNSRCLNVRHLLFYGLNFLCVLGGVYRSCIVQLTGAI